MFAGNISSGLISIGDWIEFKTDCIRRIVRKNNDLEIELVLDLNTSRLINIKKLELGEKKLHDD